MYGVSFFLFPHFYAQMEGANFENIAWLRNLGAALISVNGIGALLASSNPNKERKLYDIVLLSSCLETLGLSWSTYNWEFFCNYKRIYYYSTFSSRISKCNVVNFQA